MKKFIYGNNVFTPVDTILGIDVGTTDEVHIRCINHNKEAGAADVNNSEYVLTVAADTNITVAKALVDSINGGKLEVIDLAAFNDAVTGVTFTETPT
jgi:hypothetical protein